MNAPKISIVTPSFNQGHFIEDAICSVLGQRYPNFEHIIIDNCSSDGTVNILTNYAHLRWISEPDRGQSNALNKGFAMATGDIIGWLNADEFYLPGVFNAISSLFNLERRLGVVYGDAIYCDASGNFVRYRKSQKYSWSLLLYYGPYIQTCSLFFSRDVVHSGLFVDERFHYVMDHELLVRLAANRVRFHYVPQPLGVFRWHAHNKSLSNPDESVLESLAIRQAYGHPLSHTVSGMKIAFRLYQLTRLFSHHILGQAFWLEHRYKRQLLKKNLRWFNASNTIPPLVRS